MEGTNKWDSDKMEAGHPYDYELESFKIPEVQTVAGSLSVRLYFE